MDTEIWAGLFADLVVPLDDVGAIQERDFIVHVQRMAHLRDIAGIVVNGLGTEEGFSQGERRILLDVVAGSLPSGFPFLVGVRAENLACALVIAEEAKDVHAAGVMLVTPDDLDGAGVTEWVSGVHEKSGLPILLVPGRSSVIDEGVIEVLADLPIAGLRVSSLDVMCDRRVREMVVNGVRIFAGAEDQVLLNLLQWGASGAVTTSCNVSPALWSRFIRAARSSSWGTAMKVFNESLLPLMAELAATGEGNSDQLIARVKSKLEESMLFSTASMRSA